MRLFLGAVDLGSCGRTVFPLVYTLAEALIGTQYLVYASQLSKPLLEHVRSQAVQSIKTSSRVNKIWGLMRIFFINGTLLAIMVIAKIIMLVEIADGLPSYSA